MNDITILLVDDEQAFVEALAERLVKRGFTVLSAFSGSQALERLDDGVEVDVVILDVEMPGMAGSDALAEIKRLHPLVEVIMLTGHATVESAIDGIRKGAFDYLMKPCDMDQLLAKVKEAKARKLASQAGTART